MSSVMIRFRMCYHSVSSLLKCNEIIYILGFNSKVSQGGSGRQLPSLFVCLLCCCCCRCRKMLF